ncbi:hypothetical protein KFE25_006538 [Diacronema lutheri]|uniref:Uncharacterized protein n=1 Tax=Diacronema lutheri TaxID=2081491 RepID=A0A8J6C915_DIALT|nr:hypothetical protein KFE25_006538 [Diacronema lutheri]
MSATLVVPVRIHAAGAREQRAAALRRAIERQREWLLTSCRVDDPTVDGVRRASAPVPRAAAPAADERGAAADEPALVEADADACWVEYFEGVSPLILASPHDGRLEPRFAARRGSGTVTVRDKGATAIACAVALDLAAAGAADVGARTSKPPRANGVAPAYAALPHVLLCHVSRSVVDVNRAEADGASCARGRAVWRAYHALLARARASAHAMHAGCELLCDFHAQAHFKLNGGHDLVELGYLLPLHSLPHLPSPAAPDEPDEPSGDDGDAQLRTCSAAERSSLRRLWHAHVAAARAAGDRRPPFAFSQLVRGNRSLGELLRARGVDAVPRVDLPCARDTAPAPRAADAPRGHGACHGAAHGTNDTCSERRAGGVAAGGVAAGGVAAGGVTAGGVAAGGVAAGGVAAGGVAAGAVAAGGVAAGDQLDSGDHDGGGGDGGGDEAQPEGARPARLAPTAEALATSPLSPRAVRRPSRAPLRPLNARAPVEGAGRTGGAPGASAADSGPRVRSYFCGRLSYTLSAVVAAHGSVGDGIDGVQLELPIRLCANPFHWERLARAIAGALGEWHRLNYDCLPVERPRADNIAW